MKYRFMLLGCLLSVLLMAACKQEIQVEAVEGKMVFLVDGETYTKDVSIVMNDFSSYSLITISHLQDEFSFSFSLSDAAVEPWAAGRLFEFDPNQPPSSSISITFLGANQQSYITSSGEITIQAYDEENERMSIQIDLVMEWESDQEVQIALEAVGTNLPVL